MMIAIYEPKGMAREYAELACNLYSGCSHGCRYCYAPACLHRYRESFHADVQPRRGIIEALRRQAPKFAGASKRVLFSFTSDPYQPAEENERLTRQALTILLENRIPCEVLTKGGEAAIRDFDLLREGGGWFGTSLVFTDDTDRERWEPNASDIGSRVAAIEHAASAAIRTWVSLEPVIDPQQALQLIGRLRDSVDAWKVGKLNHHPLAREVDWRYFAAAVYDALQQTNCDYLIKESLRPYLPAGAMPERRKVLL